MSFDPVVTKSTSAKFNTAATAADFLAIWLNHQLLSVENQKLLSDYYHNFRTFKFAANAILVQSAGC